MDATIRLYQDIFMSSISIRSVLSIRPLFFKTKSSALSPCRNAKRQIEFTAGIIAIRNLEGNGGDATGLEVCNATDWQEDCNSSLAMRMKIR